MPNGWDGSVPSPQDDGAGTVYELGQDVTANADITITHVRVWHPASSNTIVDRAARFWTTGGTEIDAVPLDDVLPSGWSTFALDTPLERTAGQQFVISYSTRQYYGAVLGELPNDSLDGALAYTGGRFRGGAESFPNITSSTFYGIDVVYELGIGGNVPPVAGIAVQTSGLTATATVSAVDESPGTVTHRIEWGDGASVVTSGPTAVHTYAAPGFYAVMVTVTDAQGATDSASVPVVVRAPITGTETPYATFPDAEISLLDYLRSAIPGLACNVDIPEDYKASEGVYIRVRRVGGQPRFPASDYPMYDIEAYGPTRDVAYAGLSEALSRLAVARYLPPVTGVFGQLTMITGPQYVPDPVTKEDRWQSLITIPLRAKRA